MKDEIKEILDRLFVYRNENDEMKYQPEDILTIEDVWLLLDYITNLQEENKRLKELDENYPIEEQLEEALKYENIYKSRNEKAIEYIKEHIRIDDEYPAYMEMLVEEKDELLNILQGGDK